MTSTSKLLFFRYAIPNSGLKLPPIPSIESNLAGKLFGNENLRDELDKALAPAPMMIYCKDRKNQDFMGDAIPGFLAKFCTEFHPTPTDVGMCLTKNTNLEEIFNYQEDYSKYFDANHRNVKNFGKGNRNSESLFILQTDLFDGLNKLSDGGIVTSNVMIIVSLPLPELNTHLISFSDHEFSNQS